jgi:CheY-like chemotaxis protein
MSELEPIRGLIVDDDRGKIASVQASFEALGGRVIATANNLQDVSEMTTDNLVSPAQLDVAFIDSNLGKSAMDGLEIVRFLALKDLARKDVGTPPSHIYESKANPNKIVTVGMSRTASDADAVGSYSDKLGVGLAVDWNASDMNLPVILREVRRLKELS